MVFLLTEVGTAVIKESNSKHWIKSNTTPPLELPLRLLPPTQPQRSLIPFFFSFSRLPAAVVV
jgi:hypothetical protein